jgi:hypothetical protein
VEDLATEYAQYYMNSKSRKLEGDGSRETPCVEKTVAYVGGLGDAVSDSNLLIGTKIRKEFDMGWFDGEVKARGLKDELWLVIYTDGDQEEICEEEVEHWASVYQKYYSKSQHQQWRQDRSNMEKTTRTKTSKGGGDKGDEHLPDAYASLTPIFFRLCETINQSSVSRENLQKFEAKLNRWIHKERQNLQPSSELFSAAESIDVDGPNSSNKRRRILRQRGG